MTAEPASGRAQTRETPVRFLRGVGPQRAEELGRAGFHTVADLLFHLPIRYEDRRRIVAPAEIDAPGWWSVRGRLSDLRAIRTRRRGFVIVRARLTEGATPLPVVWFNQPYLLQRIGDGEEYLLYGAVRAGEG
ncbi:MAG: DNA helicase RecG, partial [Thermoanaerobaculia bacterium]|nr:DNA helicase RecG [Thermoanaerobaculia bacterium]